MVKLNIEMSMAALITKLAKGSIEDRNNEVRINSSSHQHTSTFNAPTGISLRSGIHTSAVGTGNNRGVNKDLHEDLEGIRTFKEVNVRVENIPETPEGRDSTSDSGINDGFDGRRKGPLVPQRGKGSSEDELPLAKPDAMAVRSTRLSWK
jgi:hypothetical protein